VRVQHEKLIICENLFVASKKGFSNEQQLFIFLLLKSASCGLIIMMEINEMNLFAFDENENGKIYYRV
jgi:hypothetical protein